MKLSRQNKIVVGIVALVLALTVGYALFSQSLNIGGTASADGKFQLTFYSVGTVKEVGSSGTTVTSSDEDKTLTITVPKLEYPGAYVQVPVVIKNTGTVDAKLLGITTEGLSNDDMEVTYTGLEQNDIINPDATRDIVITIKWKESSVTTASSLNFNIGLNYEQVKVGDITTGSSESSFPVVEGQLGDNVNYKYDNGVIEITGSGDMWETIPDTTGICANTLGGSSSSCSLGLEIAKGAVSKLNLSKNVSDKLPIFLSMYLVGMTFEDMGVTKDTGKQMMMMAESEGGFGFTEEEANEAMAIIDITPTFKSLTIQNGITSASESLLAMSRIDYLLIPNTLTNIGASFLDLAKVETVELEEGMTTVPLNLMSGETPEGTPKYKVNNLIIPSTITEITARSIKPDLLTITNRTGKAFDWNLILTGTSGEAFETGTVTTSGGDIITITN